MDSAHKKLFNAIDNGDLENITPLNENYDKFVNDYKNRQKYYNEEQVSYNETFSKIEELIDFDEKKVKKNLKNKDFDSKTLATFKVCCDFIGSLLRFRLITTGQADSKRYGPITSLAWRAAKIKVSKFLSSSVKEKELLGLEETSDKEVYKYICNLLSDVDLFIDKEYKNWKTDVIESLFDLENKPISNYSELKDIYYNCKDIPYFRLSEWFNQNYKREFLTKFSKDLSEKRKNKESFRITFDKAKESYTLASNDFYKALEEKQLETLKELKCKMETAKKDLDLAQENYLFANREFDFAYKNLSEIIDYEGSDAWSDYYNSFYFSSYSYNICFKLLISMVKIFQIKLIGSNSKYYSQITSKIWRLARLEIILSISNNEKKKKLLGLSEMNDKEAEDYLKKQLKSIDYKYKHYELREWREKDVYVHGWRW